MSLIFNFGVTFIAAIIFGLILEVFCGDVSFMRQPTPVVNNSTSAWPKLPTNSNNPPPSPWGRNQRNNTTTPWPSLGQRHQTSHNQNVPIWVRPNPRPSQLFPNRSPNINSNNSGPQTTNRQQQQQQSQNSSVGDDELREFSETLLSKDVNNAAKYVTINFQGKTTSRSEVDEAALPLMNIDQEAYKIPSIEKMMLLYNNYILDTTQNEHYTAQEKTEENNLLDTILGTSVMQFTRTFLINKQKIGRDPKEFKDILREIWFNMYSRGGGRIGSSGFEHVFLAEIKKNQISGLHNWVYFNEEEKRNEANYLGYLKKIDLGNKGAVLKYHFTFHGIDKPVGSMFIGTSPELEIALYTTCFLLRADQICPLKLNNNKFIIRTYTYRYRGKNMIGSAFPEI